MLDIVFALLAGIATAASPCILPVLPILLGASVGERNPLRPLAIIAGFILAFSAATLAFSFAVRLAGLDQQTLRTAAVAMLVVFGVWMLFPALLDRVMAHLAPAMSARVSPARSQGVVGGFVLGTSLGVVWTPCAGPVLATILALVTSADSVSTGAALLVLYAIGAGVPMLAIAYGGQLATLRVRQIAQHAERLRQVFGALVIGVAALIYFEYDALLTAYLLDLFAY